MNSDPNEPTNAQRAARIRPLLKRYQKLTGSEDEHLVSDFLADLAHWCDVEKICLSEALQQAESLYKGETTIKDSQLFGFL